MRIGWAAPCRYVETHDNLATMVGVGLDTFGVPKVPVRLALSFGVQVILEPGDGGGEHPFTTTILGPDMQPAGPPLEAGIGFEGDPHGLPGWEGHLVVPVVLQWLAADVGVYTFVFSLDERTFDVPIIVRLIEEAPE